MNYKTLRAGAPFTLQGKKGVLVTDPEYLTTRMSGLYYADVKWEDGQVQRNFMICLLDIEWIKEDN